MTPSKPPAPGARLTPVRCREARRLAGLSVPRLAGEANLSIATVKRFEAGKTDPQPETRLALLEVFEAHGVIVRPEGVGWGSKPWEPGEVE